MFTSLTPRPSSSLNSSIYLHKPPLFTFINPLYSTSETAFFYLHKPPLFTSINLLYLPQTPEESRILKINLLSKLSKIEFETLSKEFLPLQGKEGIDYILEQIDNYI